MICCISSVKTILVLKPEYFRQAKSWLMIPWLIESPSHQQPRRAATMMTSSNGNIFRVTGPLCGEFIGHRWIPRTKAGNASFVMFYLICARINGWVNSREAGDLGRHGAHHDVIVMRYGVLTIWAGRCLPRRRILTTGTIFILTEKW